MKLQWELQYEKRMGEEWDKRQRRNSADQKHTHQRGRAESGADVGLELAVAIGDDVDVKAKRIRASSQPIPLHEISQPISTGAGAARGHANNRQDAKDAKTGGKNRGLRVNNPHAAPASGAVPSVAKEGKASLSPSDSTMAPAASGDVRIPATVTPSSSVVSPSVLESQTSSTPNILASPSTPVSV